MEEEKEINLSISSSHLFITLDESTTLVGNRNSSTRRPVGNDVTPMQRTLTKRNNQKLNMIRRSSKMALQPAHERILLSLHFGALWRHRRKGPTPENSSI